MVRRPADPCRIDPFKAYIAQIQCLNKHIDRANRIVFVDPILKAFWQQRRLPAIQPRHEARHQIPRRFSKGIIAWQEFSRRLGQKRLTMTEVSSIVEVVSKRVPWNKGKSVGAKPPLL